MKLYHYFLSIFLLIFAIGTSMQQPITALQKYAPPTELQQQLDALDLAELTKIASGGYSSVFEHPQLPEWVFKKTHSSHPSELQEKLTYADTMKKIIENNHFKHIALPEYYVYHEYIIAKKISRMPVTANPLEWAREVMHFIWLAHYKDFNMNNIIFNGDKVYIIDFDFLHCAKIQSGDSLEKYRSCNCNFDWEFLRNFFKFLAPSLQEQLCTEYCTRALTHIMHDPQASRSSICDVCGLIQTLQMYSEDIRQYACSYETTSATDHAGIRAHARKLLKMIHAFLNSPRAMHAIM